jgi:hypothetical protein
MTIDSAVSCKFKNKNVKIAYSNSTAGVQINIGIDKPIYGLKLIMQLGIPF